LAEAGGIGTQFLLHTYFVYRVPPTAARLGGYPVKYLLLYGFGAVLLHTLVDVVGIDARVAALGVIIASIPVGFLLTRNSRYFGMLKNEKQKEEAVIDDKSTLQG